MLNLATERVKQIAGDAVANHRCQTKTFGAGTMRKEKVIWESLHSQKRLRVARDVQQMKRDSRKKYPNLVFDSDVDNTWIAPTTTFFRRWCRYGSWHMCSQCSPCEDSIGRQSLATCEPAKGTAMHLQSVQVKNWISVSAAKRRTSLPEKNYTLMLLKRCVRFT